METVLSKHRVEGLTDGIFAIVMTLIVLELKVPELERHASNAEILHKLRELGPPFAAFGITFMISAVFWFLHHHSMQFIKHMTRPMILINLVFLLFVSLLPFSAAMLGRFLRSPVSMVIYYAHLLVLGILLRIQWEYVRRKDLIAEGVADSERTKMLWRLSILPSACAVGLTVALIDSEWAQVAFAFAAMSGRVAWRVAERRA